jgi:protein TonB
LSSEQIMRRIVVKTDLAFPMLDGGHLRGTVELEVVIDRTGKVACARLLTGHPIAAASAIAAVQYWRFKPFVLRKRRVMVAGHLSIPYDVEGFRVPKEE